MITAFQGVVIYVSKVSGLALTKQWCVFIGCCKVKECVKLYLMVNSILCIAKS